MEQITLYNNSWICVKSRGWKMSWNQCLPWVHKGKRKAKNLKAFLENMDWLFERTYLFSFYFFFCVKFNFLSGYNFFNLFSICVKSLNKPKKLYSFWNLENNLSFFCLGCYKVYNISYKYRGYNLVMRFHYIQIRGFRF